MKKYVILSIATGAYFAAAIVFATVGGPTYISNIAWNAKDNSAYYTVHDGGGRGCPPIINKINISTLARSEVKSCDQLEKENAYGTDVGIRKYDEFRSITYEGLPYLGSVNLKNNNI